KPPTDAPQDKIFYFEAFRVCWCLHQVADLVQANGSVKVRTIANYTDNKNTFNIFHFLRAMPEYNKILKSSIDILISLNFSLHMLLVPWKKNIVTDTLSHWLNEDTVHAYPTLLIDAIKLLLIVPYTPPRVKLGSEKK
ncbi:hypothetical protein B0H10DRAFT_1779760, partial [Mycena sp. CBHHK59/15]